MISLNNADCVAWLQNYVAAGGKPFDSCATDPPYELGFMGREWDSSGVAFQVDTWRAVLDALKPGAHLVAFGGTRTYHRMACAIEDAGFEIRDQLAWTYGSGFPKSTNIGKQIDKAAGATREVVGIDQRYVGMSENRKRAQGSIAHEYSKGWVGDPSKITAPATAEAAQWDGWGTALKPAWEPICLARKPLSEKTVAANVLRWGTGALNIDACRIDFAGAADESESKGKNRHADFNSGVRENSIYNREVQSRADQGNYNPPGRFPANLCHDGSPEVLAGFPDADGATSNGKKLGNGYSAGFGEMTQTPSFGDTGNAARFFYSAKAGPLDRIGTDHATVKPVDLMRWLARMITPPGGHILEPFAGSGKTGIAAMVEGFDCTMIELIAEHCADIDRQLAFLRGEGRMRIEEHKRKSLPDKPPEGLPLFGD